MFVDAVLVPGKSREDICGKGLIKNGKADILL